MTDLTEPKAPRFMPLRAFLISALLAALYSGGGHWISFLYFHIIVLLLSFAAFVVVYGATAQNLGARCVVGVMGGAIGVMVLWTVWIGLEFSWAALTDLAKRSPQEIFEHILRLSDQIVYSVEVDAGGFTQGTTTTKTIWALETAIFGVAPVLGALAGPRALENLRKSAQARR